MLEVLATESGMLGSRSMDGLEYRASRHRSQPRRETIATTQSFHPLLDVNRKRTVDGGSIPTTQGMRFQKWTITLTKTFDMDVFPVDAGPLPIPRFPSALVSDFVLWGTTPSLF